jgi:hypothetical protein
VLRYLLTGSLIIAGAIQTLLAVSVCHLFQSTLIPNVNTTQAEFVAAEADYPGYAALTFTAWKNPGYAAGGGSSIDSGYIQFPYVDAVPHNANSIGGFWLETAAGDVILYGVFAAPLPMAVNGNIVPVEIVLNFGS